MLRHFCKHIQRKNPGSIIYRNYFLTNDYKCTEAWKNINSSPIINKINLNDFYNQLEQNYSSKGVISSIDVDIFAHALNDSVHIEELKELLHNLRLSAETGNTLESTHQATVRNFIKFGYTLELVEILKQPLNFGVFLDDFTANILLDELLKLQKYEQAADVAALVMLQEDYNNEITCALCQYASYKYIVNYTPPEPAPPPDPKKKVEEIKIRVKYLRNPYFDDHFDITDTLTKSGKTLAWMSENKTDNLSNNLEILGWLFYKKYDKLGALCDKLSKSTTFKVHKEVLELFEKEKSKEDAAESLNKCFTILSKCQQSPSDSSLEETIKIAIENAINKAQTKDIETQTKLFKSWVTLREQKLEEQTRRLDRAKRMQLIELKQKELQEEEQKLWFFENEEKIDLEIEEKEKQMEANPTKKTSSINDDNYVPPEIVPKSNK